MVKIILGTFLSTYLWFLAIFGNVSKCGQMSIKCPKPLDITFFEGGGVSRYFYVILVNLKNKQMIEK
jgi:hypothetical protein